MQKGKDNEADADRKCLGAVVLRPPGARYAYQSGNPLAEIMGIFTTFSTYGAMAQQREQEGLPPSEWMRSATDLLNDAIPLELAEAEAKLLLAAEGAASGGQSSSDEAKTRRLAALKKERKAAFDARLA